MWWRGNPQLSEGAGYVCDSHRDRWKRLPECRRAWCAARPAMRVRGHTVRLPGGALIEVNDARPARPDRVVGLALTRAKRRGASEGNYWW
ncbi:hypothetical protein GCM10023323_21290 [Streptomyces thinghirensis]|uniref:Transposase n=1 Tax=Streptomyces thinghirensis TaxID=551547 RepID=A0ABP9T238_9ACTN